MGLFQLFSILIVLSAVFAYINFRYLKLPSVIGLMVVSLVFSLVIIFIGNINPIFKERVAAWLLKVDFSNVLMKGMLSFMLFAAAIHIKLEELRKEKYFIFLFSTVSVLLSTVIVGYVAFFLLNFFGIHVELIHSLLFGVLISPTDPIAVLSILKEAGVSKSLETKIAGESLFNDGVAVVVYIVLYRIAQSPQEVQVSDVFLLFAREAIGGLVLGILLGYVGYKMIESIDNYQVEVLVTIAVVVGGNIIAHFVHTSGPLTMVSAGIIVGNHGKRLAMSDITADYVDKFWELIDEILNAVLFVLIGLELLIIESSGLLFFASLLLIGIVLLARFMSIWIPSLLVRFKEKLDRKTFVILTWGGLRGGISIALALAIKPEFDKDIWVAITYIIVCFSILVQGLTIGKLAMNGLEKS